MTEIAGYRQEKVGKELHLGKPISQYITFTMIGVLFLVFSLIMVVLLFTAPFSTTDSLNRNYYGMANIYGYSMYPNMEEGEYVLYMSKEHPDFKVNYGDIVVYYNDDVGVHVAHRVMNMYYIGDTLYLVTKGDHNDYYDDPITYNDIEAKVVKVINNDVEKWCFDAWLNAFEWWK